jgi:hypothetical protein
VSVSISGRTIAISHYFKEGGKYISHVDLLDANTLKVRYSWDQYPPIFRFSMADESFAIVDVGVVHIGDFAHPAQRRTLFDSSKEACAAGSSGGMVSEQGIIWRGCNEVLLFDAVVFPVR